MTRDLNLTAAFWELVWAEKTAEGKPLVDTALNVEPCNNALSEYLQYLISLAVVVV